MTQEDFNTLIGILSVLLALELGLVAILVAVAFVSGLLLGRSWSRPQT